MEAKELAKAKEKYSKELLLDIYEVMNEIRRFEETALKFFNENKLRGSVHLCLGQEAVSAAVIGLMRDEDYITSTHRGHGHGIAKSRDLKSAFAELMGKETGFCHGRGGSMHICDLSKGNLGANAIVGGGLPIATGGAFAQKYRGTDNMTVSFFGDGASNQGTFHEAINMAAIWKLPVVFVCENNRYGLTTPYQTTTAVEDIADRAVGYAIPGYAIDGNDVLAILDTFAKCQERARKGEGPSLIECKTYRWKGHWTGDPEVYRTREEVASWVAKDPIPRFRAYLIENGYATDKDLDEIEERAAKDVAEAAQFALDSPEPDPAHVMDGMYVEGGFPL
ncbi:MAG: thiamine pyrophosphate-dependent dehydrogenase E1 component subunit alpha [Lachnospiraceae bacterium]|jgi:pyruvate dehydrogenase E1 component alpha subunit|nr:thiamine pyrophosphate-dependent dehydrogenase E1 component subunit alpha [Lachnospiraceae bacterium]